MKRHATAVWQGSLGDGRGHVTTQSGALSEHGYSFKARFEDESGRSGTNPEELVAAAHAGCFAMQLSHFLAEDGHPAERLEAKGTVTLEQEGEGFAVKSSDIALDAKVPGMSEDRFDELAERAKAGCPISRMLSVPIELTTAFSN